MKPLPHHRTEATRDRGGSAFTLVELVIVVAIVATLVALAVPKYGDALGQARITVATRQLESIEEAIERFQTKHGALPRDLTELGLPADETTDPWGSPHVYVWFAAGDGAAKPRTDSFLVPLNSSYDLYSRGADGVSLTSLTAPVSRDDVIRANDGDFIGLAESY